MRAEHSSAPAIPARLLPTAQHSQQLAPSHSPRAPQRMTQSAPSSPTHRSFALRSASTAVNNGTNSSCTNSSNNSSSSSSNSSSTEGNGNNSLPGSPSKLFLLSRIPTPSSLLSCLLRPSTQQASLIPSTSPLSPSSPMPSSSKHTLPCKQPSPPCKPTACACACASSCSAHKVASALHSSPFKGPNHAKHPSNGRHSFPSTLARMAVLVFLLLVSNYLGHLRPVLWSSSVNRTRLLGAGTVDEGRLWKLGLGGRPRLVTDIETRAPREWEMLPEEPQLTFVPEKEDQVPGTMIRGRNLQKHEPQEGAS